jgi:hypothetical protein
MSVQNSRAIRDSILQRMIDCESFTALDVYNNLKPRLVCVQYREVADSVRKMFEAGAMETYGYTRQLTEVTVEGDHVVQACIYFVKCGESAPQRRLKKTDGFRFLPNGRSRRQLLSEGSS